MIVIQDLTTGDIGRWVVYRYFGGQQQGRIKSWNQDSVFVVYHCNNEWDRFLDFTPLRTNPKDLEWSLRQ
jgi:hypothetical protein